MPVVGSWELTSCLQDSRGHSDRGLRRDQLERGSVLEMISPLPHPPPHRHAIHPSVSLIHWGFPKFTGTFWKFCDVTIVDSSFKLKDCFYI